MSKAKLTYKDAGVDIAKADGFVQNIKDYAKATHNPQVLAGIGGFAGLFAPDLSGMKRPVLVGATDGIGTKLSLALTANHITTLGQDLVAMCVNDLICCGAKPLFFLDYFATSQLDTEQLAALVKSLSETLQDIDCALLGGETAEMPGLYQKNDFDMAGFAVGLVDQERILDGPRHVQNGDVILGLASSGLHSNGFSLVRKIIEVANLDLKQTYDFAPNGLFQTLLEPTKIYVNPILKLLQTFDVSALAHITGGGLTENLPRVFADDLQAVIDSTTWPTPPLFEFLQNQGNVANDEMFKVFNMGIGFCLIVKPDIAEDVKTFLVKEGETVFEIGKIQNKTEKNTPGTVIL